MLPCRLNDSGIWFGKVEKLRSRKKRHPWLLQKKVLLFGRKDCSLTWGIPIWDSKSNISENGLEKNISLRQVQIVISWIPTIKIPKTPTKTGAGIISSEGDSVTFYKTDSQTNIPIMAVTTSFLWERTCKEFVYALVNLIYPQFDFFNGRLLQWT